MKNPLQCGGKGGCEGATPELGFSYIAENGIVLEKAMPYQATDGVCPARKEDSTSTLRGSMELKDRTATAAAGIKGYAVVPTNDYESVMNAVAKTGPVAVAIAANGIFRYESGVFHSSGASDINHAVVLVGYGTDEKSGEDYYLVRNSWGANWGEDGYIRVKRDSDPSCSMDTTPLDGLGCALDADGSKADVKPTKVCGTIGILFDVSFPVGGHLIE